MDTFVFNEPYFTTAGHMNHDTADYVVRKLPDIVHRYLDAYCQTPSALSPAGVSEVLARAITSMDHAIMSDFQNLFPGGESFLMHANPEQLRRTINDVEGGGTYYTKIARAVGGTTALVALFNENSGGLWVANLGDCCAGASICCVSRYCSVPDSQSRARSSWH